MFLELASVNAMWTLARVGISCCPWRSIKILQLQLVLLVCTCSWTEFNEQSVTSDLRFHACQGKTWKHVRMPCFLARGCVPLTPPESQTWVASRECPKNLYLNRTILHVCIWEWLYTTWGDFKDTTYSFANRHWVLLRKKIGHCAFYYLVKGRWKPKNPSPTETKLSQPLGVSCTLKIPCTPVGWGQPVE